MDFGVETARERVLLAIRSGRWEQVEEQLTRYAAAVRAEERYRAIGEALEALRACGGESGETPVRDCLAAIERLR
ncbi:MAG: hypothetical protein C4290_12840 [Chloroflexota bacterium]